MATTRPPGANQVHRLADPLLHRVQLAVDRDAQGLEGASGRVSCPTPGRGHRVGDDGGQGGSRIDGASSDDGAGDTTCQRLLAELIESRGSRSSTSQWLTISSAV